MIRSGTAIEMFRARTRPSGHDTGQMASDGVALLVTGLVLGVVFANKPASWRSSPPPGLSQSSIEISLHSAVTQAAPPPPIPQKPLPHQAQPKHVSVVPLPEPAPQEPLQAERDSVPEGGALITSAAPATLASASDSHLELEAEYAAGLRADINRRTYPPDSAQYRLHLPSGEVRVSFVVRRMGQGGAIRVVRSSGSSILDDQALSIVASGHYLPFPAKAFAGETEHGFVVTIEFRRAR